MALGCLISMTVFEASGKLFVWFTQNDSFVMEDDFASAVVVTVDEEADKACFLCALESMEQDAGLVKKTQLKEKTYWFLKQPLESLEQNLIINFETITMICAVLEELNEMGRERLSFDPTDLSEKDLQNLLLGVLSTFPKKDLT